MNSNNTVACRDAVTGELLGVMPKHDVDDLRAAIRLARASQQGWARTSIRQRIEGIVSVRDFVANHMDELAETVARDTGKTRNDALTTEIVPAVATASYHARNATRLLKDHPLRPGALVLANKTSRILRVPWGVVGIVSPDNYPFAIPFFKIVMGLLAGNAVIVQMASKALMVGRALKRCFRAEKLAQDAIWFLNLPGPPGKLLLDCGVDKLFYSGPPSVGEMLVANASESLTPVVLDPSSDDVMLVCPDADLDRASRCAVSAAMQNGDLGFAEMTRPQCIVDGRLPGVKNMGLRDAIEILAVHASRQILEQIRELLAIPCGQEAPKRQRDG
jgi:acyl-CoA reductase-like NAD-dependent aldehyde dehydrogenase